MAVQVTCAECGHAAELQAPADVWKCNCAAQDGGCGCDVLNEEFGTEDNPRDDRGEIAGLEARLLQLRGGVAPEGDSDV